MSPTSWTRRRHQRTPETAVSPIVVRRALAAELEAVGELTLAAYLADGFVTSAGEYVGELRDAAVRDRDAEVWVAVGADGTVGVPDGVLGSVTFCPVGSPYREVAADDSEAEFRMLAVAPHARRGGVAKALTEHCLGLARGLGQVQMVLCSDRRMLAAHALYAGLGFRRLPERDWRPAPGVELWAFGLDL